MYTESDLRDALRHSASRADARLSAAARAETDGSDAPPTGVRRRWTHHALPVAAAAAVLAVATTVALSTGGDGHAGARHSTHQAMSSHPVVKPPDTHVPLDVGAVVDVARTNRTTRFWDEYDLHPGYAEVTGPITARSDVVVDIVSAHAAGFDPSRFPRTHTVSIAGTTGFYALFKLFPLDADTGPGSDKWSSHWTIAFRTPAGDWAFVYYEDAKRPNATEYSVNDPAAVLAAYRELHLNFAAGASRVPFRTGWLPPGVHFDSLDLNTHPTAPTQATLMLAVGKRYLSIDVSDAAKTPLIALQCQGGHHEILLGRSGSAAAGRRHCTPPPTRTVGRFRIQVTGPEFDGATLRHVLDTITAASDPTDPATYWSIPDALG